MPVVSTFYGIIIKMFFLDNRQNDDHKNLFQPLLNENNSKIAPTVINQMKEQLSQEGK